MFDLKHILGIVMDLVTFQRSPGQNPALMAIVPSVHSWDFADRWPHRSRYLHILRVRRLRGSLAEGICGAAQREELVRCRVFIQILCPNLLEESAQIGIQPIRSCRCSLRELTF